MHNIIFAPATAIGVAAISIIRVSGEGCEHILEKLIKGKKPKEKLLALRNFFFPEKDHVIDKCLVCWMPKNSSFTGEDSFEIQCHGGIAVMNSFIRALLSFKNVRFAEQGEFTKRAMINGKINLIDAEAINDLVQSETEQQRAIAFKQFNNGLSIPIKRWKKLLTRCMANVESRIDFSDETDIEETKYFNNELISLKKELGDVLKYSKQHHLIKDGIKIVITGKPNAGKSSLFNYLIKKEKSIVTNIPGTTRDIIEYKINLKGYPVNLVDTAGLNKTKDIIEKEGIKRARAEIKKAHLVLNIIDASDFSKGSLSNSYWNVFNKIDLKRNKKIDFKNCPKAFQISAKSGKGIEKLLEEIFIFIKKNTKDIRNARYFYSSMRQQKELEEALEQLEEALIYKDEEIVSEHLRLASYSLGRILGEVDIEEVLGKIFSKFCIGK